MFYFDQVGSSWKISAKVGSSWRENVITKKKKKNYQLKNISDKGNLGVIVGK
jgi:hypothetical protein